MPGTETLTPFWNFSPHETDHRRDLWICYRFLWKRLEIPALRGETSSYYQDDLNLTGYIPLLDENPTVLVLNKFIGTSNVRKGRVVNSDNKICNESVAPGCQSVLHEL